MFPGRKFINIVVSHRYYDIYYLIFSVDNVKYLSSKEVFYAK